MVIGGVEAAAAAVAAAADRVVFRLCKMKTACCTFSFFSFFFSFFFLFFVLRSEYISLSHF